jgi:phosphatidylserine/phosphatidylglycerophosphate/cardiolipin synthase-like enzyme
MQTRQPAVGFATNGIAVNAIAGSHVVFLAFDADPSRLSDLLGFAIRRIDFLESGQPGADRWLKGHKVFKSVVPSPARDEEFETRFHPIQSFLWSDFRAKPGHLYKFFVHPVHGKPDNPKLGDPIEISLRTEDADQGDHAIFFNRGAIASQAFAEKFPELSDGEKLDLEQFDDPGNKAVDWLSRGLLRAALDFIDGTQKPDKLRVAAYEFTYAPIIKALLDAHNRGVDVKIVYEAGKQRVKNKKTGTSKLENTSATTSAAKAIKLHGVPNKILFPRKNRAAIPHNKFIVKLRKDASGKHRPEEVWTGSAKMTMSGFLGQSNNGHLVRDHEVARVFMDYWKILSKDPKPDDAKAMVMALTPDPAKKLPVGTTALFSPRKGSHMLKWYAERVKEAKRSIFFTAAFGFNPKQNKLHAQMMQEADHMRFVLLEKNDEDVVKLDKADRNFTSAVGAGLGLGPDRKPLPGWELANWFQERHFRRHGNVFFVHLKFLLLDPLGPDPIVITGSANFSPNSLTSNDENMLLIRGDKRVAHIYFTEFDRLFRHFIYRNAANAGSAAAVDEKRFLVEDARWTKKHFKTGTFQDKRRRMFA